MRKPPPGEVWLHIDRLDRDDGRVWAVQFRGKRGGARYEAVKAVVIRNDGYTQAHSDGLQPKAYVVFKHARVTIADGIATIR